MKVLLVMDMLRDFCPDGGSLGVPNGVKIIPTVNKLTSSEIFDLVIAIKDKHPKGHISFASTHGLNPFEMLNGDTVWPDHVEDGTPGADFHPDLDTSNFDFTVEKGMNKDMDSYSAFLENDKVTKTGLCDILEPYKAKLVPGEKLNIYVVGIATDVCVKHTVLDSLVLNWEGTTIVIADACAGVTAEGEILALEQMSDEGAYVITSDELLTA